MEGTAIGMTQPERVQHQIEQKLEAGGFSQAEAEDLARDAVQRGVAWRSRSGTLMVPGAALALGCLGALGYVIYEIAGPGSIRTGIAVALCVVLFVAFIGGVFLFSFGYKARDARAALRLTMWIVFGAVGGIGLLVAVAVTLLADDSAPTSNTAADDETRPQPSSAEPVAPDQAAAGELAVAVGSGEQTGPDQPSGLTQDLADVGNLAENLALDAMAAHAANRPRRWWPAPRHDGGPPPAGWYVDPGSSYQFRYWDGAAWTSRVKT